MYFDRRLWLFTRDMRWRIVATVLMGLASAAVGMARFVFLGTLIARVFAGAPAAALILPAAAVAAAMLLRGALEHARIMLAHRTAARVQELLRLKLYDKVAELGPAWFAGERTGGVMLSLVDGVEQLQTFFGQYVPQLAIAALTPVALFAIVAWWDLPVATLMLAVALACLVLPATFSRINRAVNMSQRQALKSSGAEFLDAIQGLATLKAFGQSTAYGRLLAEKAQGLRAATMKVLATSLITRGVIDLGIGVGKLSPQPLQIAEDDGQQIVEVVCDAARQVSDRFQFLRTPQSLFGTITFDGNSRHVCPHLHHPKVVRVWASNPAAVHAEGSQHFSF